MDILKGIVIPAGWDMYGNIVRLAIATGDEQEYLIEDHFEMEQLKSLLRKEVVVSGYISHKKEYKAIQVAAIRQENA